MPASRAKSHRRRIRVALATGGLVPGGAERQMLLLAEGLPKDEFSVDFICLKLAGEYADRARSAGARVRVLGLVGKRESGWPLPIYAIYLAWTVLRYIAMTAGRYDVVDAWLYHAYALAALTRPFTRPRALLAGRRSLSDFKARFNWLERAGDDVARRAATRIVANSQAVKADVVLREGIDPLRIQVIHNGVRPLEAMAAPERRALRAGWGATEDTLVIGCVANYKPFKGLELLIRSAARLAVALGHRDIRLVLVGEGRHRPELEALRAKLGVEDLVLLHGTVPDARAIYGAFDIAALASEAEGLPNVVLEAAAAGLPIVATAAGGTVEIITDGETGLLVPIGDEDGFVAALALLSVDPGERRRLGEAARIDVATRFGVDRMVAEFAALYRELAGDRVRPSDRGRTAARR
jgi:glycosyltransferase involved in cell wall biosynthesis